MRFADMGDRSGAGQALNPHMNHEYPGRRIMLYRTRLTGRWAVWGGILPFRRGRHRLTARQLRAQSLLELLLLILLGVWIALMQIGDVSG
jgi:hypothetical protein